MIWYSDQSMVFYFFFFLLVETAPGTTMHRVWSS